MNGLNVYLDPWIATVADTPKWMGIRDVLRNAGSIRSLGVASPLESFAVLRLLLAFIHWRHPLDGPSEWKSLWASGGLPEEALADLPSEAATLFELVGDGPRFYQDRSVASKKTVGINSLFADLPSGSNINHATHSYDGETRACLRCVSKALACLPAFATQGGRGKSPSVNGAPPVYFYPEGNTLLQTLLLNLPVPGVLPDWPLPNASDRPAWDGGAPSGPSVGFCEGLTWQARKVYLKDDELKTASCHVCGAQEAQTVAEAVFEAGRKTKELNERTWRDPHSALVADGDKPLRAVDPTKAAPSEARRWRDELEALLAPADGPCSPPTVRQSAALLGTRRADESLNVSLVRHPTSQMKLIDAAADTYELPLALLGDASRLELARRVLGDIPAFSGRLRNALGLEATEPALRTAFLLFLAEAARAEEVENPLERHRERVRNVLAQRPVNPIPSSRNWSVIEKLERERGIALRVEKALSKSKGGES